MTKQVLTLAVSLFFISSIVFAQGDKIWFDANWKKTSKDKALYFRKISQKNGKAFWFQDYYISGKKQMEGLSLKKDIEFYDGLVTWYFENGKIFQKVNYINGYINGERLVYFKNGKLKTKLLYERGRKNGPAKEYYQDGRLKAFKSTRQLS